ncbi:MAG TPA: hypothetical protein VHE81_01310 [Lacipirellulaceae bacterium]|nr:hypothetical protein [Lacipirellulaceae bacterium]
MVHSVSNGIHSSLDLTFEPPEFRLCGIDRRTTLHPQPVHLARELVAEFLEQRRVHQVMPECIQNALFEAVAPDVLPIVAGAFVPCGRASDQIGRDHGVAATAAAAFRQAGEEIFRPSPVTEMVLGFTAVIATPDLDRSLTRLGGGPEFVIENAQLRHVLDHPLRFRVWPRLALAGVWVFDEPLPVPDHAADIHLVVEDAVAPLGITVERAEPPIAAIGRADALLVQLGRNPLRRFTGHIVPKNSADDLGLSHIDRAVAADRLSIRGELLDDIVAVGIATSRLAQLHAAALTAACLVGQVLQEERIHRALEADMQMRDLAF